MKNQLFIIAVVAITSAPSVFSSEDLTIEQAVPRLQAYLQIDTVNPPGNESRGASYLASLLDQAGISYETAESAPGRGNLWARLKGGTEPALVLLHHIDVVPADDRYWDLPALSGEIENGYVYGRGAVDTKGLGIAQLQAFIALKQSGRQLNRDVIYVATADEEAGGFFGAGWLLEHHPEIFEGVGYLINEGGSGMSLENATTFGVEVTQKVPLWLRLTATDVPGHGSAPRTSSAVQRIVRAGNRIADTNFERRVVPAVDTYFKTIAQFQTGELKTLMSTMVNAVVDDSFYYSLKLEQPWQAALLSNTCSLTTLQGSEKINVVPPTALLELDCRLLPDEDPGLFVERLAAIIADDKIEITRIMGFTPAVSEQNTPLYEAIEYAVSLSYEDAILVPSVATGFTDSHFFRDVGIVSYGFAPFVFHPDEKTGVHGNNERITIENLQSGTRILRDLLMAFTSTP